MIDYVNSIYGTRKIIRNKCEKDDWIKIGRKVPKYIGDYVLSECLICGNKIPISINNMLSSPPKSCPFCSNYGKNSFKEKQKNIWIINGNDAVGLLKYKDEVLNCYIDKDYLEKVQKYLWRISKKKNKYYVVTGSKELKTKKYLHQFIVDEDIPKNYEIDHIDGNELNNRRSNLRIVSRLENIQNSKARIDNKIGIRGICKIRDKYKVDFSFGNKRYYFADFKDIVSAVYCRKYAEEYFGLEILNNNPIAKKYLILDDNVSNKIKEYVYNQISLT